MRSDIARHLSMPRQRGPVRAADYGNLASNFKRGPALWTESHERGTVRANSFKWEPDLCANQFFSPRPAPPYFRPGVADVARVEAGTYQADSAHSLVGWRANLFGFND